MGRRVVICVGNHDRGDDGVGHAVAALLRDALSGVELIEQSGEATAIIEAMDGAERAILVDACLSGAPPGTVRRLDATAMPPSQSDFGGSSHGLGVAVAIELVRALGRLPPICAIYAIEGECFRFGAPLSLAAVAGADEAARLILAELAAPPEA